jgi:glycerol-3-phosphate cytidylyltransferase-like family protein
LNTNKLLEEYKGRKAVLPWEEKALIISSIRWVDRVVPATEFSPLALLRDLDVDVYCLSHEWESTKTEEIAYMRDKGGSIFWTTDYPIVRTSEIKRRLLMEAQEKLPSHW